MDCQVCSEKLFGCEKTVFSTFCGHIFHETCLRGWMQTKPNESDCPQCRKPINNQTIHPIFLDAGDAVAMDQMLTTQISSLSDLMKSRDQKSEETMTRMMDSLEKMTVSMSAFEYQNQLLRQSNEDLKKQVEVLHAGSQSGSKPSSGDSKDSHKTKDATIATLLKENGELRAQRAETTREMFAIREQISQLKNNAKGENKRPLRDGNEPRQQNLTLKFDNVNDKLIIE